MNKSMWMLLVGAVVMATCIVPAVAQKEAEVAATETEYCGICEAKKQAHEALPDWFTFGVDHRFRQTYFNNATTLDDDKAPGHERLFMRNRSRLWAKAAVDENIEIGARLVWEWFYFCKPDSMDSTPSSDVTFDELYVKVANVADQPLTLIVGRQNMRLGDGWLVFEGTPLDGSRTIYFDAVRAIYELADYNSTVNAVIIANRADTDSYIKPFNDDAVEKMIAEYDETGAVLWVTNTSQENMQIDGYYIYADRDVPNGSHTLGQIHTFGGRVAGDVDENTKYRVEAAFQFGEKEDGVGSDARLCGAWGLNSRVTHSLNDERDTAVHAGYEYRSGNKDPMKNFDILFGRYPQFSEILNGYADTLEGPPAAGGNFHRFNVGAAMTPCENALLMLNYNILFADNNNMTGSSFSDGCLRGNLLSAQLKYTHNHHMASTVTAEVFVPGDYYSDACNDTATFARYELMLVW